MTPATTLVLAAVASPVADGAFAARPRVDLAAPAPRDASASGPQGASAPTSSPVVKSGSAAVPRVGLVAPALRGASVAGPESAFARRGVREVAGC